MYTIQKNFSVIRILHDNFPSYILLLELTRGFLIYILSINFII
jgi:hypothetical protein